MKIKGKRILRNGTVAGYVLQKDKTWRWQFLKKSQSGGASEQTTGPFGEQIYRRNGINWSDIPYEVIIKCLIDVTGNGNCGYNAILRAIDEDNLMLGDSTECETVRDLFRKTIQIRANQKIEEMIKSAPNMNIPIIEHGKPNRFYMNILRQLLREHYISKMEKEKKMTNNLRKQYRKNLKRVNWGITNGQVLACSWFDDTDAEAFSDMFNINIIIYRSDTEMPFFSRNYIKTPRGPTILLYNNGSHWQVVDPICVADTIAAHSPHPAAAAAGTPVARKVPTSNKSSINKHINKQINILKNQSNTLQNQSNTSQNHYNTKLMDTLGQNIKRLYELNDETEITKLKEEIQRLSKRSLEQLKEKKKKLDDLIRSIESPENETKGSDKSQRELIEEQLYRLSIIEQKIDALNTLKALSNSINRPRRNANAAAKAAAANAAAAKAAENARRRTGNTAENANAAKAAEKARRKTPQERKEEIDKKVKNLKKKMKIEKNKGKKIGIMGQIKKLQIEKIRL